MLPQAIYIFRTSVITGLIKPGMVPMATGARVGEDAERVLTTVVLWCTELAPRATVAERKAAALQDRHVRSRGVAMAISIGKATRPS